MDGNKTVFLATDLSCSCYFLAYFYIGNIVLCVFLSLLYLSRIVNNGYLQLPMFADTASLMF